MKICRVGILQLIVAIASIAAGASNEATVTQVVNDVKLLPTKAAPRPAAVKDLLRDDTGVRTGSESRTELTFLDQTIARLGANTIFGFHQDSRDMVLTDGALLFHVPKGVGGAKVRTTTISVSITGTTGIVEFHGDSYIKVLILEGEARVSLAQRFGESMLIRAGQMLITEPNGWQLADPTDYAIEKLFKTSLLINGFAPLSSRPLILREIKKQKNNRNLLATNLVVSGGHSILSVVDTAASFFNVGNIGGGPGTGGIPLPTPTPTPSPASQQLRGEATSLAGGGKNHRNPKRPRSVAKVRNTSDILALLDTNPMAHAPKPEPLARTGSTSTRKPVAARIPERQARPPTP